ncbi:MAG: hypothetical protein ACRDV9_03090 [Acidimicrobiia bacterium]
MMLHRACAAGVGLLIALMGWPAFTADQPVVTVSRGGLTPDRIEVHLGEIVRWRAVKGVKIRLELDPHRDAHEVIERLEEIRAVFRRPGEHWYVASIVGHGHRNARGLVVVRESNGPASIPLVCGPASSDRICIAP